MCQLSIIYSNWQTDTIKLFFQGVSKSMMAEVGFEAAVIISNFCSLCLYLIDDGFNEQR